LIREANLGESGVNRSNIANENGNSDKQQ
jgi:hypothetical protein